MDRRGEEEAWRAIVDNYGERPELTLEEPTGADAQLRSGVPTGDGDPVSGPELLDEPVLPPPGTTRERAEPEERFVPPPPPPLPRVTPRRAVAWFGVLGAPVVLLGCLLASVPLPTLVSLGLVAWFVGGFIYLVLVMPAGPRDPWDDGARV